MRRALLNGTFGAGPSQASQFKPAGGSLSGTRAGAHAAHVIPHAHKMHFADLSVPDHLRGLGDVIGRAVLGSNLHDALVAAHRVNHGLSLRDRGT